MRRCMHALSRYKCTKYIHTHRVGQISTAIYLYILMSMHLHALSNIYGRVVFLPLTLANAFCFMHCLGLLTHCLFISSIILHHAQYFNLVDFPNSMFAPIKILCV